MPAHLEVFATAVAALFGLIWGSYLNVVVYRLPKGLSTAVPASHCPRCSSRIRPFHNVPVLSWILLGARCRDCRGAISARYPLVEMAVAAIFVLGVHRFDQPFAVLASWVLGWTLLVLGLIDFDRRLVPLVLTLPLGLAGWVAQWSLGWTSPWSAVWTAMLAFLAVLGLTAVWTRLPGRGGVAAEGPALGLGDAYAVFLLGSFFGPEPTLRIVFLAALAAVVVLAASWLAARVSRWAGRRALPLSRLPMVTFLAFAALWVLLLDPHGLPGSRSIEFGGLGIMAAP